MDVHVAKKIPLLKLPSDNSPTGWVVNLIHFSPLVRPILHKSLCLTNHPKREVTVPGCFFSWERRLFWPSMEAEQRNNISVSPGTWTHDSTKPVFFSYVWESGLLYHIFYFLWSDFESFWHLLTKENGQHMHTKEIIQLSLEDIIIGVVTTKRHLLNNYSLYANHW